MKTIILSLVLTLSFLSANSQQLYVKTGATHSNFIYKNSQGEKLDNLLANTDVHFGLGYRYLANYETIFLTFGGSINNYGAVGSDPRLDNYFEWDLTYAGIQGGVDIKFLNGDDFSLSFSGNIGAEYLIRGSQIINNQIYNIHQSDEYNPLNINALAGLMGSFKLSHKSAIAMYYTFGRSLLNSQGAGNDNEKLNLQYHQISIGYLVNISNVFCPF